MAFDLKWLSRVEQTSFLDKTSNPIAGMDSVISPQMWVYNGGATGANDTAAAIEASGYFNSAKGYLNVGDVVYIFTNNPGFHFISVATNNGTTVTTSVVV